MAISKSILAAVAAPEKVMAPAAAPAPAAPAKPAALSFWARMAARFDDFVAEPTAPVAVEFAPGRLVVGRQGGAPIQTRAVAPEAVVASAVRPNLADPAALAALLHALLEAAGGLDTAVTLLLPDLTARVSVLDFDILPTHRQEIDALARFRLRKSLPFADEQAVISSQVLAPTRLLVTVADRARVNEYENCLEAAGARAATVIPSGLACLAAQPVLDHGALLIRADDACLTTAFCLQGKVEFFRAIELSAPANFDDVFPSVAFFRDRTGDDGSAPAVLLLAGGGDELEMRLREEIPWAQVRVLPNAEELAVAGALRGHFA